MSDSILNHRLISERYFFPRAGQVDQPFWIHCGDVQLGCAYYEFDPGAKTLVYFHGNGEIVADYQDGFPQQILQMGINCLLVEYRGYGASTGQPEFEQMLNDVSTILDSLGQSQEKLIIFGRSVGSLFAVKALDSHPRVSGLILESAIADLAERLLLRITPKELGTTKKTFLAIIKQCLDIKNLLQSYHGPVLIMHTKHDGLIDVRHAHQLASWTCDSSKLVVFARGDHNSIMAANSHEYFRFIRNFLDTIQGSNVISTSC